MLPIFKYLSLAKGNYPDCLVKAKEINFDKIISQSFRNNRSCLNGYSSVKEIWINEKNLEKATRLIAHLEESQINVDELEDVLKKIFESRPTILDDGAQAERTNIRRLIRIFDWLKYSV
jgi:vancomycin permeability regulator SanA